MRLDANTLRGYPHVWAIVKTAAGKKGADSWGAFKQLPVWQRWIVARDLPSSFTDATFEERLEFMRQAPAAGEDTGGQLYKAWYSCYKSVIMEMPALVPGATWDARAAALSHAPYDVFVLAIMCPAGTPGATPEVRVAAIPANRPALLQVHGITVEQAVNAMIHNHPDTRDALMDDPRYRAILEGKE